MPYQSDNLYVTVKNNYGSVKLDYIITDTIYPDCELSRFFCKLARTKILTPSMIDTIKKEGYTLNVAATTL